MADLQYTFPDDSASNAEKRTKEFGKKVAQAIEPQWFGGQLSDRRLWIDTMRSYSRGEQDVQQYKDTIEGKRANRENSNIGIRTHKIDYTQLKVMPTFKDILINQIDESEFKPRAEAIDITAVNEKKDYMSKLNNDYYTSEISNVISQEMGVNITPENLPKNERELEARKLEFKPLIEIAQELAIESVMKLERFEAIKDKIDEDLVDLGFGVGRHYTDYSEGIKMKYVDPYNYIHNAFQMDDGRDIRYHGIVEKNTMTALEKEVGGISKSDKKIIRESLGKTNNDNTYTDEGDASILIEYMTFAYLLGEQRVFKKLRKNKSVKLIDRSEDGYSPLNADKKLSIPYQVWYEGVYIPATKTILKWEKIENQVEGDVNKPIPPFIVYAPKVKRLSEKGRVRFDSMVQRAKPIIDDLHRDWYKFQQLKMELRPNTTEIDVDSLNSVMLNGKKVDPKDLLDLFFGRSLLLKKTLNDDGEPLPRAVTESGGGINNSAIQFLSNEFANNYNRLRQLLGVNEIRDGTTTPNSKTAVSVQKLLLASSNNATNHIVKASFSISLRFAESISYRLIDVLSTPALKDRYLSIIGTDNVELLDVIKKIPMHKFGIYFDFRPDDENRVAFESSLINSYNLKEINVAQYNKARQIRNDKSAIKYLEYVIEENTRIAEQNKLRNIQENAKANAQVSVITEQTKQQTMTIAWETKKQELLLKASLDDEKLKREAMVKELSAISQHEREMELKTLEVEGKKLIANQVEDRKDERVNQSDTNESKKIHQRQTGGAPINFNNDLNDIFKQNPLPTNL